MNKDFNNGFEYVDLNLPSKTLWSVMNVGANKLTDAGLYFQWGDVIGYTAEQVGNKKLFNRHDYKWNPSGDVMSFRKYTTTGAELELMDDAAHINMGGSWHMPTPIQLQELIHETISDWVTLNDTSGMKFTSKKDSTKYIFIPAAGYATNRRLINSGNEDLSEAYIWSSMLDTLGIWYGVYLDLFSNDSNHAYLNRADRKCGLPVRGVIG